MTAKEADRIVHLMQEMRKHGVLRVSGAEAQAFYGVRSSHFRSTKAGFAWSDAYDRLMYLPPEIYMGDAEGYVCALHEIGHIACRHFRRPTSAFSKIWAQEIQAWEWAVRRLYFAKLDEVAPYILSCLLNYL